MSIVNSVMGEIAAMMQASISYHKSRNEPCERPVLVVKTLRRMDILPEESQDWDPLPSSKAQDYCMAELKKLCERLDADLQTALNHGYDEVIVEVSAELSEARYFFTLMQHLTQHFYNR